MGEQGGRRQRVGGAPAFVAAHGVARTRPSLTFEQAYGLARLVLELGGGPVPVRGRKAPLTQAVVRHLTAEGLVEQIGESRLTEWFEIRAVRNFDPGGGDYTTLVRSLGAGEDARWFAVATDAGVDLVRAALAGQR